MKTVTLKQLRPTQATHGLREVNQKIAEFRSRSKHAMSMAVASKPIPVVLGPGAIPFAIDHHHVAAALYALALKKVPCVLVADLSSLSPTQFWLELDNRSWVHPYDKFGRRIAFDALPRHIDSLEDDEYRSLAAFVRDAGGYEPTTVPLAEFRWADLFRSALPCHEDAQASDADFARLLKWALRFAKGDHAIGLPGYRHRRRG